MRQRFSPCRTGLFLSVKMPRHISNFCCGVIKFKDNMRFHPIHESLSGKDPTLKCQGRCLSSVWMTDGPTVIIVSLPPCGISSLVPVVSAIINELGMTEGMTEDEGLSVFELRRSIVFNFIRKSGVSQPTHKLNFNINLPAQKTTPCMN